MSFHNGALSTNEEYMKTQFSDPYGYTDWDLPQPQISPNTIITIPKLASGSSGSVCMFTLDWNQWSLNTQHSVPFAVIAEQRLAGRNENRNPIYDVWAFNSTHPLGVSISGIKPKVDDFNAGGGNTGGNTGSNRTSAVIWKRPGDEKSDPPIGTIAASIVGGIASFLILAVILVKLRRRGRSQVVEESAVETASRQDTGHVVPLQSETSSTKGVPPPTYEEAIKR
ncbi:hypothetical protein CC86DRAFT_188612 [Ophiobolus disseminans]|uniref:Uncharacterized protein n=1 Tax=Ophiobolus disseminans TaxID=1469910 RepID=A0A6A7A9F0_9PLEO|nr:hypothetical protein CC86DRAFT_188612 [Ophiobolus disseminans]